MRNTVQHAIIILGMVSSLITAEYSGSNAVGGGGIGGGYGLKSGFESSYNAGFVGEYAGHLSAGKAIGELQAYREQQRGNAEHGNRYEQEESQYKYSDAYGQEGGGEQKYDNSQYEGYEGKLDISKFPLDVEANHYAGNDGADEGLEEEEQQQPEQQQYGEQKDYQGDDQNVNQPEELYKNYRPGPYKGYQDPVGMLIIPYSGHQPEGQQEQQQQQQQHYSGYQGQQQSYDNYQERKESYSNPQQSFNYKPPKEPYRSPYESSNLPVSSYNYESQRAPGYNPSYEPIKATSPTPILNEISESSVNYAPHGAKYHYSAAVSESPSKPLEFIQKIKLDSLKNFHSAAQKNVMTIDHGKGSYSYSSLYRP